MRGGDYTHVPTPCVWCAAAGQTARQASRQRPASRGGWGCGALTVGSPPSARQAGVCVGGWCPAG